MDKRTKIANAGCTILDIGSLYDRRMARDFEALAHILPDDPTPAEAVVWVQYIKEYLSEQRRPSAA